MSNSEFSENEIIFKLLLLFLSEINNFIAIRLKIENLFKKLFCNFLNCFFNEKIPVLIISKIFENKSIIFK